MSNSKANGKSRKLTTAQIVFVGVYAAILAVLSQISIPLPSGVPLTLQTFAVALIGVVLSWKLGAASVGVYILLGAVGVPVFSGFSGGLQILVGYTGGFIWGFLAMVIICGFAGRCKNKVLSIVFMIVGVLVCHVFGILQFSVVMDTSLKQAALLSSIPYLIKDVISAIIAYIVGKQIVVRARMESIY